MVRPATRSTKCPRESSAKIRSHLLRFPTQSKSQNPAGSRHNAEIRCLRSSSRAGSSVLSRLDGSRDPEGEEEEFAVMSRLASGLHRLRRSPCVVVWSVLVSCGLMLFSQVAVAMVPHFFPSLSLIAMLPISGLVFLASIAVGRFWKRFIGVAASAPLFVLFNILFLWGVHVFVIRRGVSSVPDMIFNAACALLISGFYRIFSGDPGVVAYESSFLEEADCKDFVDAIFLSEKLPSLSRIRHCNYCKSNVRGYDHHCPAFGNCIGQKNHRLFMALLLVFIIAESTYTIGSTEYITGWMNSGTIRSQNPLSLNVVISTMLFSILQVLWQVLFLLWHIYCICFNIKTDEWINWKRYPEFQMKGQHQSDADVKFVNPYDKGVLCNIREFLKPK